MNTVGRQGINFGLGASLVLMAIATFGVIHVSVIANAVRVR